MRKTFNNDQLEAQFQKDGYVKVPFLSVSEVEELKAYYFDTLKEQGGKIGPEDEAVHSSMEVTYDFTFIDKNVDYKKLIFQKISSAFAKHVDEYLQVINRSLPILFEKPKMMEKYLCIKIGHLLMKQNVHRFPFGVLWLIVINQMERWKLFQRVINVLGRFVGQ